MAERNGEVVVAGYHRDISTGGSWLDVTSIFTMISERPDLSGSWDGPFIVHSDVEVLASQGDPVSVAISEERLHILFQTERDDITGVERLGVLYSHGERDQEGWNFIAPVGDNARTITSRWMRTVSSSRHGLSAKVKTRSVHRRHRPRLEHRRPDLLGGPGALSLSTIEREHGVMVMYDEISVRGPVVRLGLLAVGEGTEAYALANILETGQLLGAGGETADVVVGFISTTGALDIRILADANPSGPGGNDATWLDDLLAPLPGDRDMQMLILGGSGLVVVVLLLAMVLTARRALRRRPEDDEGVEKELDEDVVMMITPEDDETPFAVVEEEETIVAVMDDEEEEPEEEETIRPDPVNARQERRRHAPLPGHFRSRGNPRAFRSTAAGPRGPAATKPCGRSAAFPPCFAGFAPTEPRGELCLVRGVLHRSGPPASVGALPDLWRERGGVKHVWHRWIPRSAASGSNFAQRTPPLGVPGLRQRGLGPPWRCFRRPQANRKGRRTGSDAPEEDARDRRHCPHPLGHPWRRHRRKRSPHLGPEQRVVIVHNGIIENATRIRRHLERNGATFRSKPTLKSSLTVSSVPWKRGNRHRRHANCTEGLARHWGVCALFLDHDELVCARNGSPLVLGETDHGFIVTSDPQPLVEHTDRVIILEDGDIASYGANGLTIERLDGGQAKRLPSPSTRVGGEPNLGSTHTTCSRNLRATRRLAPLHFRSARFEKWNGRLGGMQLTANSSGRFPTSGCLGAARP